MIFGSTFFIALVAMVTLLGLSLYASIFKEHIAGWWFGIAAYVPAVVAGPSLMAWMFSSKMAELPTAPTFMEYVMAGAVALFAAVVGIFIVKQLTKPKYDYAHAQ